MSTVTSNMWHHFTSSATHWRKLNNLILSVTSDGVRCHKAASQMRVLPPGSVSRGAYPLFDGRVIHEALAFVAKTQMTTLGT